MYLIWSNEHRAWWGPNGSGYVPHLSQAGRYPRPAALEICKGANYGMKFGQPPNEVPVPEQDMLDSEALS